MEPASRARILNSLPPPWDIFPAEAEFCMGTLQINKAFPPSLFLFSPSLCVCLLVVIRREREPCAKFNKGLICAETSVQTLCPVPVNRMGITAPVKKPLACSPHIFWLTGDIAGIQALVQSCNLVWNICLDIQFDCTATKGCIVMRDPVRQSGPALHSAVTFSALVLIVS